MAVLTEQHARCATSMAATILPWGVDQVAQLFDLEPGVRLLHECQTEDASVAVMRVN